VTLEAFLQRHGGDIPLGSPSAVVPAAVDALVSALDRFGTWGFAEVVEPAIAAGAEGFPLDRRTATALEIMGRSFCRWDSSREVYWPKGRPPRPGEILRQTDLARTLETLAAAERGATRSARLEAVRAAFYDGPLAERIVSFNRATGGWLSREDLSGFRCDVVPAPGVRHGEWQVFSNDFGTQGPVALQALGILSAFDLAGAGGGSAEALHWIIEALKIAFHDRERHYCDPAFARTDLAGLLAPTYLARRAAEITATAAERQPTTEPARARPRFDTTALCAVDRAGNAIAVVPSDTADGGPIVPGLGLMVSCRGVQSRLNPEDVNVLAPGKRPRITPAALLALRPETAEILTLACPGGDVIVQAMLQVYLNCIVHGMQPQPAVEAPRLATFSFPNSFFPNPDFPGRVDAEARLRPEVLAELARRGHRLHLWPDVEFDAGGVLLAGRMGLGGEDGPVLVGAADPRRSGYGTGR
jgi:gamma-glutamyltranspeptidase/glutathione hydrolase